MFETSQSEGRLDLVEPAVEIDRVAEISFRPTSLEQRQVTISTIQVSSHQPRRFFEQQKLEQLARSIKTHGILENLIVRPLPNGNYELVAGERRLRAALMAELTEVPVTIRELTNEQALNLALIENLQRADLNPIEETEGILQLLLLRLSLSTDEIPTLLYRLQHEARGQVAHNIIGSAQFQQIEAVFSEIGRFSWKSFIVNRLPLLKMPPEILSLVRQGRLAYTKAQAISRVKDQELQKSLLEETVSQNLSLGQLRQRIQPQLKPESSEAEVPQNLLNQTYQQIQSSPVWHDPQKRERVKELLRELSALLKN